MGRKRLIVLGLVVPLTVMALIVAAWAVDTSGAPSHVIRNVELAGVDIGGEGSDALLERIESLVPEQAERAVQIITPQMTYSVSAADLGFTIDVGATSEAALDTGRRRALPLRPVGWLLSFLSPRQAEVHYDVDLEAMRARLRQLEGDAHLSPREPTILSVDGGLFEAVPGQAGLGIDAETLASALLARADGTRPDEDLTVEIQQSALRPRLDDSVAAAAAEVANEWTDRTIGVRVGGESVLLEPDDLRRVAVGQETADGIVVVVDQDLLVARLSEELPDMDTEPQDATFTVDSGGVHIVPDVAGARCCSPDAAAVVTDALDGTDGSVSVELESIPADFTTADAQSLGIVEEVGSPDAFGPTTRHACCESRVTNIHRIADIVRGHVIRPGATFSINDFVGPRTLEKGFVSGGVIYAGVISEDIGGGVSQFATTLFNAALFAGLDVGQYQSHSLYISRYPRGREATISYPQPDLEIVNDSPYGVLIWPTYTDTSLTVHLYSTRHVAVTVGEPTASPRGNCTRWTTSRTRTWDDGRVETDSVHATYRPEEGVSC